MIPPPAMAMEGELDRFELDSWGAEIAVLKRFADTQQLSERTSVSRRHYDLISRFK